MLMSLPFLIVSGRLVLLLAPVYDSVDVRTFLTEVLCRAGYNALATAGVGDAEILLKATRAKLVILGAHMQTVHGKPTRKILEEIDPSVSMLVLDEHFSQADPGDAAAKLLQRNSYKVFGANENKTAHSPWSHSIPLLVKTVLRPVMPPINSVGETA